MAPFFLYGSTGNASYALYGAVTLGARSTRHDPVDLRLISVAVAVQVEQHGCQLSAVECVRIVGIIGSEVLRHERRLLRVQPDLRERERERERERNP